MNKTLASLQIQIILFLNLIIDKEGFKSRKKLDRVEFKRSNWKNYFKIEWKLIKNTINYLRI